MNLELWPRNCSSYPGSGTSESFPHDSVDAQVRTLRILFSISLVTGGQVSRVDPESMGLNPAWRNSLAYTTLGAGWQDGANLTEINAARQLLIHDMSILEGIAPESGAYFNEVRTPTSIHNTPTDSFHFLYTLCRVWVL